MVEHEGRTWLRRWRVRGEGEDVVLDLGIRVLFVAMLLLGPIAAGAGLFLLGFAVDSNEVIVAGMFLTVLSIAMCIYCLQFPARECIRLTPREFVVTRRRGLRRRETRVELTPDARVEVTGKRLKDALALSGWDRYEPFGWGLGARHARRVVEAFVPGQGAPQEPPTDGVVRRSALRSEDGQAPRADVPLTVHPPLRRAELWAWLRGKGTRGTVAGILWLSLLGGGLRYGLGGLAYVGLPILGVLAYGGPYGIAEWFQRRRVRRARRLHPYEPWLRESVWRGGITRRSVWARLSALRFGLISTGVLIVAAVLMSFWFAAAFLGLSFTWLAYKAQNVYFAGETEVRFPQLPVRPGETVAIDFAVSARGATFHDIWFVLLRVTEQSSALRPINRVFFTHSATYRLPQDQHPPLPGEQVRALFRLPDDAPGANLHAEPPHYWELTVHGSTNSGDYEERFLVPVFCEVDPALIGP